MTHLSVDGHLDYLQFLDTVDKTDKNMDEQLSLYYHVASFGYMPKSNVTGY